MTYIPRLKKEYKERIIAALKEEFGYKNVMQVPKLEKIVVSRGVGSPLLGSKRERLEMCIGASFLMMPP